MNQNNNALSGKAKEKSFRIRQTNPEDYDAIYELIRTAFQTAKVKDGDEQDFAVRLRNSENYIPALDLIAEEDGKPIGHIMFTDTFVLQSDGTKYPALLVAPLSVLWEHRNKGVGGALMREGFRIAKQSGYRSAFLCGDPDYYTRFGYTPMAGFGIQSKLGIPERYALVHELIPGTLNGVTGILEGF